MIQRWYIEDPNERKPRNIPVVLASDYDTLAVERDALREQVAKTGSALESQQDLVRRLREDCCRISEEIGLPGHMAPAEGELRKREEERKALRGVVEKVKALPRKWLDSEHFQNIRQCADDLNTALARQPLAASPPASPAGSIGADHPKVSCPLGEATCPRCHSSVRTHYYQGCQPSAGRTPHSWHDRRIEGGEATWDGVERRVAKRYFGTTAEDGSIYARGPQRSLHADTRKR